MTTTVEVDRPRGKIVTRRGATDDADRKIGSLTQLGDTQRFLSADSSVGITIIDFSQGFAQSGSVQSFAIEGQGNVGATSPAVRSGSCFVSDQKNNVIIDIDVNNSRDFS